MSILVQGNAVVQGSVTFGASPFLLDNYSNAAAAYSTRKLSSTYSGSAIRVRRSSDNTEQDIGFDANGNLDETALTTFVGANSGFVTTWYDQSGNTRNATQTTQANQPRIVNTGVVDKQNNKPALLFDGTNDLLNYDGSFFVNSKYSVFIAISRNSNKVQNHILGGDNNAVTNANLHIGFNTNLQFRFGQFGNDLDLSVIGYATTVLQLYSLFNINTGKSIFFNSILGNSNSNTTNLVNGYVYPSIGRFNTSFYSGYASEIVLYANDQSVNRSGLQANINRYYQIYWQGNGQALLDQYPSAAAAYSVRALNSSYTGPLIRVRRSSDNAETDIYALYDGSLDEASLTAFCGAGGGFISTWYDQSGAGRHASQTTSANQPRIVNAGVIDKQNTKPTVVFDGSNYRLTGTWNTTRAVMLFTAVKMNNNASSKVVFGFAGDVLSLYGTTNEAFTGVSGTYVGQPATPDNQTNFSLVVSQQFNSGSTYVALNNVVYNGTNTVLGSSTATFQISGFNALFLFPGNISELIVYTSDQSSNRIGVQENINSYYSIY